MRPGTEKKIRRTLDITEKKYHLPVIDRTPDEPPPLVVTVMGPPQCGKTTLIKSLVKRYTRQNLGEIKGPITVVSGTLESVIHVEVVIFFRKEAEVDLLRVSQ